jgi:hypothetical protein
MQRSDRNEKKLKQQKTIRVSGRDWPNSVGWWKKAQDKEIPLSNPLGPGIRMPQKGGLTESIWRGFSFIRPRKFFHVVLSGGLATCAHQNDDSLPDSLFSFFVQIILF